MKGIITFLLMLFSSGIYVFALLFYKVLNSKNIYYMCAAMALYSISMVIFLMAKRWIEKAGSYILMSVFGVNLYVEILGTPTEWKWKYYLLIIIMCFNFFLFALLIEKFKK